MHASSHGVTNKSIPWYFPVDCPLRRVHGGVTAGGDKIEGGVLSKLRRHRLPVQAWFPLCLFQHLQDLFHHNVAPFFRQMQPIPAIQKNYSVFLFRPAGDDDKNKQQTTHVKHAVIQSSLFCMACQRSITFRFISLHRPTQASEYRRQVSLVRTISLSIVLLHT